MPFSFPLKKFPSPNLRQFRLRNDNELFSPDLHTWAAQTRAAALKNSRVQAQAFLDGKALPLSSEKVLTRIQKTSQANLSRLPFSIRMTNVHQVNPLVRALCRDFFKKTGRVLSANLYFTPNAESQCFLFHADLEHALIYQVSGSKRWSFPLRGNKPWIEKFPHEIHVEEMKNKTLKTRTIQLTTGDWLNIPFGAVHKAENDQNAPSIHLTFSVDQPYFGALFSSIGHQILNSVCAKQSLTDGELREALRTIRRKSFSDSRVIRKYLSGFKEKERERRKLGRDLSSAPFHFREVQILKAQSLDPVSLKLIREASRETLKWHFCDVVRFGKAWQHERLYLAAKRGWIVDSRGKKTRLSSKFRLKRAGDYRVLYEATLDSEEIYPWIGKTVLGYKLDSTQDARVLPKRIFSKKLSLDALEKLENQVPLIFAAHFFKIRNLSPSIWTSAETR